MKKIFLSLLSFILLTFISFAQGPGRVTSQEHMIINIAGGNISDLSKVEINGMLLMREEEKLARDVYLELYDAWGLPLFKNIASSELTHTNAVKNLIQAYGLKDPVISQERGVYDNEYLSALYTTLVDKGKNSLMDALVVGATVEDLDIKDLKELLEMTTNKDIIIVYENLHKGSRNHLRSFNRQIENNGGKYIAQYLTQSEINSILATGQERGMILQQQ